MPPDAPPIPRKLDLKKDVRLRIEWADGSESIYPILRLRQLCPCAACRMLRTGSDPHKLLRPATPDELEAERTEASRAPQARAREHRSRGTTKPQHAPPAPPKAKKPLSLNVLPKHFTSDADAIQVTSAQLVGNYALQITFSDGHTSGIFSFTYLREINPT